MQPMSTSWWHVEGDKVVCTACPRECHIPQGQRGFCYVRANVDGRLELTTWGRSSGFCIDPIEKKPLAHFLPGTPVLSFGTAGCNLGCKFCQNHEISKSRAMDTLASDQATPEAIVATALRTGCRSLAFTYNDPTIWAEYAIDVAREAHEHGLKTVSVTAGYINPEARAALYDHIDAANVDLKSFTEKFYRSLTQTSLRPVLDTLVYLVRETRVWVEITTLVIPGHNDSPDEIAAMSAWIERELGPAVPLHFSAFHPDHKMLDTPPTPHATLLRCRQIALDHGLRHVYVGNVNDPANQSTWCPSCGQCVIGRDWYELTAWHLREGKCDRCGTVIPGVFEDSPGQWGNRRQPVRVGATQ